MMYKSDMTNGALAIGDVVAPASIAGLFVKGAPRWYALCVNAQKEVAAEQWLSRRGVYAFHPVREFATRRFGKDLRRTERYLPGYVFARFDGDPVYSAVLESPFIWSAVTRLDGEWGVLRPDDLRYLHAMRRLSPEVEEKRAKDASAAKAIRRAALKAGDRALFRAGPFIGAECEVIELGATGAARVRLMMFGREVLIPADPAILEKDLLTANHDRQ